MIKSYMIKKMAQCPQMNHPLTHQSDGSFDVISSISLVHYYDSYNFISNFTSTLQKDYTI